MNSVDATYQSSLRELNETNFARFDAKVEQRMAELKNDITTRIASSESRMIRWMVTLWTGSILATLALLVTMLQLR